MAKNIFILNANPDKESLSTALAEAYASGARAAGHDVRLTHIADMKFDPILHKGYKVIQAYEPDLVKFQEDVRWSNHFVTVTPLWWSNVPALFKGLLDRAWMPGFGFNFKKNGIGWYRRLKGRSARVIITSNTPHSLLWFLFGTNYESYTRAILRFSGFGPVRKTWFSGMKGLTPEKAARFIECAQRLGKKGK